MDSMPITIRNKGFTLIELLVVIAIIGLLASTILASVQQARVEARDVQRIQTLKQIENALELFRSRNGRYPCSTANWSWSGNRVVMMDGTALAGSVPINDRPTGCSDLRPFIDLPEDPVYLGTLNDYLYRGVPNINANAFVLRVRMEGIGDCVVNKNNASLPAGWITLPNCY